MICGRCEVAEGKLCRCDLEQAITDALPGRRERVATAVLSGFAEGVTRRGDDVATDAAVEAVRWADALIAELDRTK